MMLNISQEKLANALGVTFQQVQKYEKGANRIGAGRLQHIAEILNVPISFFFESDPNAFEQASVSVAKAPPDFVSQFLAITDESMLIRAFTRIKSAKLRRRLVDLVEQIADQGH